VQWGCQYLLDCLVVDWVCGIVEGEVFVDDVYYVDGVVGFDDDIEGIDGVYGDYGIGDYGFGELGDGVVVW